MENKRYNVVFSKGKDVEKINCKKETLHNELEKFIESEEKVFCVTKSNQ